MKNESSEREIKGTPFTIATNRIKYLGINLSKERKQLCSDKCKTVMKEIKDLTKSWKDIPYTWN